VSGGGGSDTLIGPDEPDGPEEFNSWEILGPNTGNLNGKFFFESVESLSGGSGDDTFYFRGPGSVDGIVDGGDGLDILDFLQSDFIQEAASDFLGVNLPIGDETVEFTATGGIVRIEDILVILLAEVQEDGTLVLNMGPRAAERLAINTEDGDEVFTLSHVAGDPAAAEGETIRVSAFGIDLDYTGVRAIRGWGGQGNDSIILSSDILSPAELDGGVGNDLLVGGAGADVLYGGEGNDILEGGPGSDLMDGGTGDDQYIIVPGSVDQVIDVQGWDSLDFSKALLGVTVDFDKDRGQIQELDAAGNELLIHGVIENATGSEFDDRIYGNRFDNVLDGRGGDDRLYGECGDDLLAGGAGDDYIVGGWGEDLVYFPDAEEGVTVEISCWGNGWSTDGLGGTDTLRWSIDGAIGTDYDDILIGDDSRTEFHGMGGDDFIDGRGGNDLLYGGEDNDTIRGDRGNDYIEGGTGDDDIDAGRDNDTVIWTENDGNDSIDMDYGWDTLRVFTDDSDDTVTLTSPARNQVEINGTGSASWDLSVTRGDIFEINTGGGDDVVEIYDLDRTDVNEVVLHLGAGDDRVEGAEATETIKAYGEGGDDRFVGGSDDDTFDGGEGTDWVDYSSAPKRVKVDLRYKAHQDGRGSRDYLKNVESIAATPFSDDIWGTDGDNEIWTLGGNDDVWARGGDDLVYGGEGRDELRGDDGNDVLYGGEGDDELRGGRGNDYLYGEAGDDYLRGEDGDDTLEGGAGEDRLYGDRGEDALYGGQDDDDLDGGSGDDVLYGEAGDDYLRGEDGDDTLEGGVGEDRLYGDRGEDALSGGRDDDDLYGGSGDDVLYGEDGDDYLRGESDDDTLEGGVGEDRLYGDSGEDILAGGMGDDYLRGGSGDDDLSGGEGNDRLYGDSGGDLLAGGEGDDYIEGGSGEDLLYFPEAVDPGAQGVTVEITKGGKGDATDALGGKDKLYSSIDGALGTQYDDTLIGDDSGTEFHGGAGDDFIDGRGGDDLLYGDEGDDTIRGDRGDDYVEGGAGDDDIDAGRDNDTVIWTEGDGNDSIDMDYGWDTLRVITDDSGDTVSLTSPDRNEVEIAGTDSASWDLSVTRGDIFEINTGGGDDVVEVYDLDRTDVNEVVLHLGAGDDRVEGAEATETIKAYGEAGNDWFVGGSDDDTFDGGEGTDWVDYSTAPERVKVDLKYKAHEDGRGSRDYLKNIENVKTTPYDDEIWGTDAANEIWTDDGNDKVYGRRGDDVIYGGGGDDKLYGDDGDDLLKGEAGDDYLRGGDDEDRLEGGTGDDRLYGDHGDDLLAGGAGDDRIEGGRGEDLLYFHEEEVDHGVHVEITNGGKGTVWDDGQGYTDSLHSSIDGAYGTQYGDTLIGDDSRTEFHGGAGDDYIEGRGGDDLLYGDEGEDTIYGGSGRDVIAGGADNDKLDGESGNDTVMGGGGDDLVSGGSGDDLIVWNNGDGSDTVDGGAGMDDVLQLFTGSGNDEIEISVTDQFATEISRTNETPFTVNTSNAEIVKVYTESGDDTVIIYGSEFPGIRELYVDLGEDDDVLISAGPGLPPDYQPGTHIDVDGGAGDNTFMTGPGKGSTDEVFPPLDMLPPPQPIEPVSYWNFNEILNDTAHDSAGVPEDGVYFGSGLKKNIPGPATSFPSHTATEFHGNKDEYVAMAHDEAFEVANGTVQLWFNPDRTNCDQTLFAKDHYGYKNGGHLKIGLKGSRLEVRLQSTNKSYYIKTGSLIKKDQWYHLAFTFGEEGMKLYLNGKQVGKNSYTGGLVGNKEAAIIGGSNWANRNGSGDLSKIKISQAFYGRIDEVAFFDKPLNTAQIKQLMQSGPLGVTEEVPPIGKGWQGLSTSDWVKLFVLDMAQNQDDDGPNGGIKIVLDEK